MATEAASDASKDIRLGKRATHMVEIPQKG